MFLALLLSSLLTFVELNCENLFDTRHDSLKNDMEFTPEGSYHWTRTRYWRKLNNLAKELVALGEKGNKEWEIPDLVAMCEVENDTVMTDLTKRSLLRLAGYEYLMTSSPDERGIDVALMYLPSSFCPLVLIPYVSSLWLECALHAIFCTSVGFFWVVIPCMCLLYMLPVVGEERRFLVLFVCRLPSS